MATVNPRNPFRDRIRRRQYDACIHCYNIKHKDLIYPNGSRCRGNAIAGYFWRGYDNSMPASMWDRGSKEMVAYAAYRAGQDVAKAEGKQR